MRSPPDRPSGHSPGRMRVGTDSQRGLKFNCIGIYTSFVIFAGGTTVPLDFPFLPTFAPLPATPPPPGHCRLQLERAKAQESGLLGLGCGSRKGWGGGTRSRVSLGFQERRRERGKLPGFGIFFTSQDGNLDKPEIGREALTGEGRRQKGVPGVPFPGANRCIPGPETPHLCNCT